MKNKSQNYSLKSKTYYFNLPSILKEGTFTSHLRPLTDEDILVSYVFDDMKINLVEVFPEEKDE